MAHGFVSGKPVLTGMRRNESSQGEFVSQDYAITFPVKA